MSLIAADLVSEVEARLGVRAGSLRGNDLVRATAALGDAIALVQAVAGSAIADPPQPAVRSVVLSVARRAYLNPAGVTQQSVGPHSVTYGSEAASGVYLTSAERTVLTRLSRKGTGGLWALSTTRGDDDRTLYVGDQLAPLSDPIPFEADRDSAR